MVLILLDHFHNVTYIALQCDTDFFYDLGIDVLIFPKFCNGSCTDTSSPLEIFFLHIFID